MSKEQLIEQINSFTYLSDASIRVNKIRFIGNKSKGKQSKNRQIWVYFEKQKYPCGVYKDARFSTWTQSEPSFVIGVSPEDKDYWTHDARVKLCHWLFCRFWIWLKGVDFIYDWYVNGNCKSSILNNTTWEIPVFTGLIHDGWSIQKHCLSHLFELSPSLKEMYKLYNEDVDDDLYKNYGHIEYGDCEYKELTTKEEISQVRIGF